MSHIQISHNELRRLHEVERSYRSLLEQSVRLEEELSEYQKLRPEVLWFAQQSEKQLRKHDGTKGIQGWKDLSSAELENRMRHKFTDVRFALFNNSPQGIIDEATHLANYTMMLADNARRKQKGNAK